MSELRDLTASRRELTGSPREARVLTRFENARLARIEARINFVIDALRTRPAVLAGSPMATERELVDGWRSAERGAETIDARAAWLLPTSRARRRREPSWPSCRSASARRHAAWPALRASCAAGRGL